MSRRRRPRIRSLAGFAALLLIAALARQLGLVPEAIGGDPRSDRPKTSSAQGDESDVRSESGAERVARAFAERESEVLVTLDATVDKVLSDDRDGSRHQRFLIRLPVGPRLLVAHNIDLAERVPIEPGTRLRLRGQYEWNERGGVLHWTHHDPDGRHPGGWIEVDGRRIE